jgi:hypothetical protein
LSDKEDDASNSREDDTCDCIQKREERRGGSIPPMSDVWDDPGESPSLEGVSIDRVGGLVWSLTEAEGTIGA